MLDPAGFLELILVALAAGTAVVAPLVALVLFLEFSARPPALGGRRQAGPDDQ